MSPTARFTAFALVPVLLLGGCLGSLLLLATAAGSLATQCGPTGPAAQVDPAGVPKGPVAGYRGEQLVLAAHIMRAAQALGMSKHAQTIGVMTAIGESTLTVLDRGPSTGSDARGLFQQRANGAWGSYTDRMNPTISATNFFRALQQVDGWETLPPTIAAHRVQRNENPYHYEQFWPAAVQVVEALAGVKPAGPPATTAAAPTAPTGQPAASSSYALGQVQPAAATLANTLGPMFGIKTIGGYRDAGREQYDPNGHPAGLALDFMIDNIPGGRTVGDQLASYVVEHSGELGVKYVIWQQRIWSAQQAGAGWRLVADRGSPTQNHMDHVHVSLQAGANPVPGAGPGAGCEHSSVPVAAGGWTKPAVGPITSQYGMRINPVSRIYKLHTGTDLGAECQAPIYAAADGTVVASGPASGYGNLIALDHGTGPGGKPVLSRYGHMFNDGLLVRVGDTVQAGQQIARVGTTGNSTGCHLHFEVQEGGEFVDPVPYLAQHGAPLG